VIQKLYKLKQSQLDQKLMLKQQLEAKKFDIDKKIDDIDSSLLTMGVQKFGAIGDFKILAIHKNSMKYKKSILQQDKRMMESEINRYNNIIIEHQKEVEKYNYLVKEQIKLKLKEQRKQEEMIASEYVLSKYSNKMVG